MNFALVRVILAIALPVLAFGGVWYHGYDYANDKWESANAAQAQENAEKLSEILENSNRQTRQLYERKIRNLEKALRLPRACDLPVPYRELHNESGGLPPDTEKGAIAADTFARTVAENYSRCLQNAAWLADCQKVCGE
jgi:hypothetical protein